MLKDILPIFVLVSVTSINIFLAVFVLIRNIKKETNQVYSIFTFFIAIWAATNAIFQITQSEKIAFIVAQLSYVAGIFLAGSVLYFSFIFPSEKQNKQNYISKHFRKIIFTAVILLNAVIFIPGLLLKGVNIDQGIRGLDTGPILPLYGLCLATFFGYTIYNLIKKYRIGKGIEKKQILFVVIGLFSSIVFGLLFNLILPLFGLYDLIWLGPDFVIILVITTGYAMVRYRLMDLRIVISRSILYFLLVSFVAVSFVLTGYVSIQLLDTGRSSYSLAVSIGISIFIVLILPKLNTLIATVTDRVFFRKEVDYQKLLQQLTNVINTEIDLTKLIHSFTFTIESVLKIKNIDVILLGKSQMFFNSGVKKEKTKDDKKISQFLIKYLNLEKKSMVTEEIQRQVNDTNDEEKQKLLQKVVKQLEEMKTEIIVPVFTNDHMTAILLLGRKLSGATFTQKDIDLFQVISPQIASAIEKAKLYQESQQFNATLKIEVKKATARLEEANKYLQELDKTKSEFMSVVSHQLRTPLTAIIGYTDMMVKGDYGPLDPEKVKILREVVVASRRLSRLVDIFLNIGRIEDNRLELDLKTQQIEDILVKEIFELALSAKNKGLKLVYSRPKTKLPSVNVDADKIMDVTLNLIDNAIKYTQSGGITITSAKTADGRGVHIKITDTGIGIDPEEAKKLFNKFVRGNGIARIQPNGSGLGLFIAKKLIEVHGGKIWVESEGEGKGSTFQFILPAGKFALKRQQAKTIKGG